MRGRGRAMLFSISLCLLVVFLLSSLTGKQSSVAEQVTSQGSTTRLPEDALVVLGMQLHDDGMPRASLKLRVEHAARLFKVATRPVIVLLSGARKLEGSSLEQQEHALKGPSEASVMQELAECAGIHRSTLWKEERATNTAENAAGVVDVLWGGKMGNFTKDVTRVRVVTNAWHIPRALAAFEAFVPLDKAVLGEPAYDKDESEQESKVLLQRTMDDLRLFPSTLHDIDVAGGPPRVALPWRALYRWLLSQRSSFLSVATDCIQPRGVHLPVNAAAKWNCVPSGQPRPHVFVFCTNTRLLSEEDNMCNIANHVFVEATPKTALKIKRAGNGQVLVHPGHAMSSNSIWYRFECIQRPPVAYASRIEDLKC